MSAPALPPAALDPQALARRVLGLPAARFEASSLEGRRRLATRVLDALRARMAPLPRPEMLVGVVLALPGEALGVAALALEVAAAEPPLADGLAAAWARTAADARELFGLGPEDAALAAFEGTLAANARDIAARLSLEEALAEPSRAEYVARRVAAAAGVPLRAGKRVETPERRAQALKVLDPLPARENAARLGREERAGRALAALAKELAAGGALPGSAKYAEM
jgi:hypothetical protein